MSVGSFLFMWSFMHHVKPLRPLVGVLRVQKSRDVREMHCIVAGLRLSIKVLPVGYIAVYIVMPSCVNFVHYVRPLMYK